LAEEIELESMQREADQASVFRMGIDDDESQEVDA
jgi:hypothetical protein